MEIVCINQTFGIGGAENFNLSILKYLSKTGHSVFLYTNNNKFQQLAVKSNIKAKNIYFEVDLIGDWKGFVKGLLFFIPLIGNYLSLMIKHRNADIFYFTGYIEKVICTPILKIFGKRIIWIEFGPLDSVLNKFFKIPKILYLFSSKYPDKCIFSSQNTLIENRKYYASKLRLEVIQLGSPKPPTNLKILEAFDVFCLSRLQPSKGQDLLIKAFLEVVKVYPRAKLKIAGTGDKPYINYLKSLIKTLNLQQNVELLGYIHNKYEFFLASKFSVFPSVWPLEGFGLVVTESLSMGKPVIAYDRSPVNEIIKSGYNGLLGNRLADNIIKLLKDNQLLSLLSKNALSSWKQAYQEDYFLQKYANSFFS